MECSVCGSIWEDNEERLYCPKCGKLAKEVIKARNFNKISRKQIGITIISGFLSYVVILFIFQRMTLPFTFEFYLGIDSSFIMGYYILYFFLKSPQFYINDFFPYYKLFFLILGILIFLSYFLIMVTNKLIVEKTNVNLFPFVLSLSDFFVGYLLGIALIVYFYIRTVKRHRLLLLKEMTGVFS